MWYHRFRGLESEAIEHFTAKLSRAKAVVDMNRPKVGRAEEVLGAIGVEGFGNWLS